MLVGAISNPRPRRIRQAEASEWKSNEADLAEQQRVQSVFGVVLPAVVQHTSNVLASSSPTMGCETYSADAAIQLSQILNLWHELPEVSGVKTF